MINMYPEMTKTLFYLCCSCLPACELENESRIASFYCYAHALKILRTWSAGECQLYFV